MSIVSEGFVRLTLAKHSNFPTHFLCLSDTFEHFPLLSLSSYCIGLSMAASKAVRLWIYCWERTRVWVCAHGGGGNSRLLLWLTDWGISIQIHATPLISRHRQPMGLWNHSPLPRSSSYFLLFFFPPTFSFYLTLTFYNILHLFQFVFIVFMSCFLVVVVFYWVTWRINANIL